MKSPSNAGKAIATPAMTKGKRDRNDTWPLASWHAIELADQLREEIVGIQLLDDQLQERARPGERSRACCTQAQHARATLSPPAFGIELLFDPEGLFAVDVGDVATDLAHGSSSTNDGARERTRAGTCGGPGQSA